MSARTFEDPLKLPNQSLLLGITIIWILILLINFFNPRLLRAINFILATTPFIIICFLIAGCLYNGGIVPEITYMQIPSPWVFVDPTVRNTE